MTNQNPFTNTEEARKYLALDNGHYVKNYAIIPTVLTMLGDVRGSKLLDVGCGYGLVSGMLSEKGARVVGIDASSEMIRLAQDINKSELVSFYNTPAEKMIKLENYMFDDAISILVLNYVNNRKDLDQIFSNIYENLRYGGRFIAFQNHMVEQGFEGGKTNSDRVYEKVPSLNESSDVPRFKFTRTVGDDKISFELNDWPMEVYRQAAVKARFRNFRQCNTQVSLDGILNLPQDYWINYATRNIFLGFEVTK